jgi:hypothetical protein
VQLPGWRAVVAFVAQAENAANQVGAAMKAA